MRRHLCAMNFRNNLDSAAMRRFGIKVKFDYLDANQAWEMFVTTLDELCIKGTSPEQMARLKSALSNLCNLAPGDFNAAKQCLELMNERDMAAGLLKTLQSESRLKPDGGRQAMGFAKFQGMR